MSPLHYAFGLRISSNIEIPGFAAGSEQASPDVEVTFGSFPDGIGDEPPPDHAAMYVSPSKNSNAEPSLRIWRTPDRRYFRIRYGDRTECVIDAPGERIWIRFPSSYKLEDVIPYLQGQLLGFAQRLRGVTCLHASAIVLSDCAIAVTGPAGSGKSTTAAAFLQLGYPILADDVLPMYEDQGKFWVRPAHQRICLCPDAVEALFGSADALPRFAPSWEKRYLDLRVAGPGWTREPKPLAAIYVLTERSKKPDRPTLIKAAPRDTLLHLLCNTYLNHLLDQEMRSTEFALLARLQKTVPVRLVRARDDGSKIQELCETILADTRDRNTLNPAHPHS